MLYNYHIIKYAISFIKIIILKIKNCYIIIKHFFAFEHIFYKKLYYL